MGSERQPKHYKVTQTHRQYETEEERVEGHRKRAEACNRCIMVAYNDLLKKGLIEKVI